MMRRRALYGVRELSIFAVLAAGLAVLLALCGAGWIITNLAFMTFMSASIYLRRLDANLRVAGSAVGALAYALAALLALLLAFTGPSPSARKILVAPSRSVGFPWPGSDAGFVFTAPIWILSVWLLMLLSLGIAKSARALRRS